MTLRKMLLLIGMVLTAVAFAAPAVAQAGDEWYTDVDGEAITLGTTTSTGDTVEFTGTMTWTKFPLKQSCMNTHVRTILWNPEIEDTHTATGEIYGITYTVPCTVGVLTVDGYKHIPGCEITAVESTGLPWHMNVATGTNGIDIWGANFTFTYNGCGGLGIPNGAKIGFSGTMTGTWNNEGGCITFNNSGDLKNAAGEPVNLDDGLCNNKVTLK